MGLGGAAAWIVRGLLMALLMSFYWLYWTPQNLLESFMAFVFCSVTAWLIVKILGWCFRSGGSGG